MPPSKLIVYKKSPPNCCLIRGGVIIKGVEIMYDYIDMHTRMYIYIYIYVVFL